MRISLTDALEAFLISLEAQGRSPRTIKTYQGRLSTFINSYQAISLADITPANVDAWMVSLRRQSNLWADHPGKPTEKGKLSAATLSSRLQALKTFMRWCVHRGYINRSPAEHLQRIPYSHADKVMEQDDLEAMVKVARKDVRDFAIIMFIADTGARVGEVAEMTLDDLNLEECEAKVNGKTKERYVFFTDATRAALKKWLEERPDECDHDYVFAATFRNHRGRRLKEGGIYQMLNRLGEKAGVEGDIGPHSIRHLVGKSFVENEGLVPAQHKLGHKHPSTTAIFYSHQDNRDSIRASTNRSSIIKGVTEEE